MIYMIFLSLDKDIFFPLAPRGVLAPGSAHARPSAQPPIDTSGNISVHVSKGHLQTSPPTPQKSYPKFRNPRTTFENTPLTPHIYDSGGGGPRIIFLVGILLFLLVRSPCKISEPYDNSLLEI